MNFQDLASLAAALPFQPVPAEDTNRRSQAIALHNKGVKAEENDFFSKNGTYHTARGYYLEAINTLKALEQLDDIDKKHMLYSFERVYVISSQLQRESKKGTYLDFPPELVAMLRSCTYVVDQSKFNGGMLKFLGVSKRKAESPEPAAKSICSSSSSSAAGSTVDVSTSRWEQRGDMLMDAASGTVGKDREIYLDQAIRHYEQVEPMTEEVMKSILYAQDLLRQETQCDADRQALNERVSQAITLGFDDADVRDYLVL